MTPSPASHPPVTYAGLVRENRNFRRLWFGQIVSLLGDWFNMIACATLIAQLTQSGAAVGGLFVVRMLAPFLMSPFAGVAADRYNRKSILIITDLLRAVLVLGFLGVGGPRGVWFLYGLTALQLGVSGFFYPARSAILPSLVRPEELGTANTLSSVTWSVMLTLGTALGGLATGLLGVRFAFLVDSSTFVISALCLWGIRYTPEPAGPKESGLLAGITQYADGLRYLFRHRSILYTALLKPSFSLTVSGAMHVAMVELSRQVFVIGEGGGLSMGLMFAAVGAGTGIGPIVARRITGDSESRIRLAIALGFGVSSAGLAVASLSPILPGVLAGLFFEGFGGGIMWVFSTQLLLQNVPGPVRGRVFATEFALFTLFSACSAALGGWAIDAPFLGVRATVGAVSALVLIPGCLWAWSLRRFGPKG